MAVNVHEWVSDYWSASYYSQCASGCTDPENTTPSTARARRGGSFDDPKGTMKASYRGNFDDGTVRDEARLRCCRTVSGPAVDAEASCDGLDDDCDGVTDEGCPCDYQGIPDGVCAAGSLDPVGICSDRVPADYEVNEATCDGWTMIATGRLTKAVRAGF